LFFVLSIELNNMTKSLIKITICLLVLLLAAACTSDAQKKETNTPKTKSVLTARDILGNPDYLAISYGGYRKPTRDIQPTVAEIKEDMKILSAMGVGILRTYNTKLAHATNVLKAIRALRTEDSDFEMYVMVGAWIDCKDAWTAEPNHEEESEAANQAEIERATTMAMEYPDIVKVIAVGNEAMVKWAGSYYVQPGVILKWVNHLQELKAADKLPKDLWITSSDNFASWGGGEDTIYHTEDLTSLIKAVDFVSMHTYPMHDTHYNPAFWGVTKKEKYLTKIEKIDAAMKRAGEYAQLQYENTADYVHAIAPNKPIHIGETGWATESNGFYGGGGSKATDEYKSALYYKFIRNWTAQKNIACFYFEAFDEPWKDAANPGGSENHFGLFDVKGKAKYALWDLKDRGVFKGLSRDGKPISKTLNGDKRKLFNEIAVPPQWEGKINIE